MKLGTLNIANLKLGNTAITKVMRGTDLIWSSEAWEQIKELAQADGWYAVYNFDQANTITLNSGKVASIADALATLPNQVQATSANQPTLTANAIGNLDAAVFTGTQNLNIATATPKSVPIFVMLVYQYDGAVNSSANVFAYDASANTNNNARFALLTANGTFAAYGRIGGQKSFAALDNNPHITGIQFTSEKSSPIYHDGTLVLYEDLSVQNPMSLIRIGSDYLAARKWNGKISAMLIYEGNITNDKAERMFELLSTHTSIPKVVPPNTATAYSTMRVSDGAILNTVNGDTSYMIASMTKTMTCLVMQDYVSNFATEVTVHADDINNAAVAQFVQAGDVVSYNELVAGAMIPSDNNAPMTIARTVGYLINPSAANNAAATAAFVTKMNEKAVALGMTNTTYTEPWNFAMSTANDQLKLFKHIYDRPSDMIKNFWGLLSYTITTTGANPRSYTISSSSSLNDRMLIGVNFLGGKTGTWSNIGSLGFVWDRNGGEDYITVVLNTPSTGNRFYNAKIVVEAIP